MLKEVHIKFLSSELYYKRTPYIGVKLIHGVPFYFGLNHSAFILNDSQSVHST